MKKLFILGLLFSSLSFAQEGRMPEPICLEGKLHYQDRGHFWQDFCTNGLGISTPQECVKYQRTAKLEKQLQEARDFLKKKHEKICGKK